MNYNWTIDITDDVQREWDNAEGFLGKAGTAVGGVFAIGVTEIAETAVNICKLPWAIGKKLF